MLFLFFDGIIFRRFRWKMTNAFSLDFDLYTWRSKINPNTLFQKPTNPAEVRVLYKSKGTPVNVGTALNMTRHPNPSVSLIQKKVFEMAGRKFLVSLDYKIFRSSKFSYKKSFRLVSSVFYRLGVHRRHRGFIHNGC